ncbi:TIGR00180 family glycosyltransferase [Chloroflexota bacterium]
MITLIIPTMNRPDFLIRQLYYYRDVGFQGHVCIGDSSNARHIERTKRAIEALAGSLHIVYKEYPGLNDAEVIKRLLEFVVTPYAAFVADDDFLIPTALEQCALFLEEHSDYNSAHGTAIGVKLESDGAYGQVVIAHHYQQPIISDESSAQRILYHLTNYEVTLFSVHRIESWRKMYQDISLLSDKTFASELLPCCLSVIQGKAKELDCLYLVRQDHSQRYYLPGKAEWVRNPNWPPMYQIFRDLLAKEVAEKDGIGTDRAQEVIEQAFGAYMTKLMGEQWQSHCGKGNSGIKDRLRQVARMIPGALWVWLALHSSNTEERVEIPLVDLLTASPSYYSEFIPINQALSIANAELPEENS